MLAPRPARCFGQHTLDAGALMEGKVFKLGEQHGRCVVRSTQVPLPLSRVKHFVDFHQPVRRICTGRSLPPTIHQVGRTPDLSPEEMLRKGEGKVKPAACVCRVTGAHPLNPMDCARSTLRSPRPQCFPEFTFTGPVLFSPNSVPGSLRVNCRNVDGHVALGRSPKPTFLSTRLASSRSGTTNPSHPPWRQTLWT